MKNVERRLEYKLLTINGLFNFYSSLFILHSLLKTWLTDY